MHKPVVLITGASGFIGQYAVKHFLGMDYHVIGLTREQHRIEMHQDFEWIHDFDELHSNQIDYVINLAGENIGAQRWTDERKETLLNSRLDTTRRLYEFLKKNQIFPRRILSTSAVGYYGIDPEEQWQQVCTEESAAQQIFMSQLCAQWEQLALSYTDQNTKIMRFGVVLGRKGGLLPQILMPIKLNLFGKIGSGRQPFSWVHIQDLLSVMDFLMHEQTTPDIFNVVAPEKTSQLYFSQTAARVLNRKPLFCLPGIFMKWLLGEQSQLILNGQYVRPKALQDAGFKFEFPTIKEALIDLVDKRS
ncbi:TIGR01777 family protein [Acinetobacter sp. LoGeW2-3]|uniref:TIGR01777 family oxidoreductase n=1 Tax=Acinetobacter sp. LoGeW2-3 TaxID=1808001 RepID=UPI000C059472|nr:TIGR01777 family oxidoreductase [Acinetobacter sp. LoGeW2-3]ATO18475.1 TIGR01777 family protein [Acinetobacter sp. LoGeW2-3]